MTKTRAHGARGLQIGRTFGLLVAFAMVLGLAPAQGVRAALAIESPEAIEVTGSPLQYTCDHESGYSQPSYVKGDDEDRILLHNHGTKEGTMSFTPWDGKSETLLEGNYCLTTDVERGTTLSVIGTVNLCLNGHGIKMVGTGGVINVPEGSTLNLYDCNESNLSHTYIIGQDGLATVDDGIEAAGAKTFMGGYITGGQANNGGGIYVNGGSLLLVGGTIIGNIASGNDNAAGGGIYANGGSVSIEGGAIRGNLSPHGGGGVFLYGEGVYNMGAGVVEENTGYNGSGVYAYNATLSLSGGSIVNNVNNGGDGGLFINGGSTLKLSNSPIITGNIKRIENQQDKPDNLAIRLSVVIIEGALTNTDPIGVSLLDNSWNRPVGVFTTGSTQDLKASDYLSCFTSDNSAYEVTEDGNELRLSKVHVHSFNYAAGTDALANTITAICSGEGKCGFKDEGITLTLRAPASVTYDGTAKTATFFGYPHEVPVGLADEPTFIEYYTSSGAGSIEATGGALSGAPSDAGDYVAKVTWGNATASAAFSIAKADLTKAKVVLAKTSYTCTGKAIKPAVKSVTLGAKALKAGTDYYVNYKNNSNPGTATVTITGKGNYKGTVAVRFGISLAKASFMATGNAGKLSIDASWDKVPGAKSYDLQYKKNNGKWTKISVKAASKTITGLKAGSLYQLRVRAVADKQTGAWSNIASLYLRTVDGVKLASKKAGVVTASWKVDPKANAGYVVLVRYKKDGDVVSKVTVAAGKKSVTVKGLKRGKKVLVSICPMCTSGGTVYTGSQSSAWVKVK